MFWVCLKSSGLSGDCLNGYLLAITLLLPWVLRRTGDLYFNDNRAYTSLSFLEQLLYKHYGSPGRQPWESNGSTHGFPAFTDGWSSACFLPSWQQTWLRGARCPWRHSVKIKVIIWCLRMLMPACGKVSGVVGGRGGGGGGGGVLRSPVPGAVFLSFACSKGVSQAIFKPTHHGNSICVLL